jgi:putative ABC transport system permease protein
MVPITYNIRNLLERKGTTLMTALGIGMTVAVLVVSFAMVEGLRALFSGSGHPAQVIVLRKGTDAELTSSISNSDLQYIRTLKTLMATASSIKEKPVPAEVSADQPLISPEACVVANLPSSYASAMNISVRGLTDVGLLMRNYEIQKPGVPFNPNVYEVIVGESIAQRYPDAQLGKTIAFGKHAWKIVGIFHAADQAANSEVWCGLNLLAGDFDRQGESSSLLVRLDSPARIPDFKAQVEKIQDLHVNVVSEKDYYASMTASGEPLEVLGFAVAIIMAVGSAFAATNTMYAAVARRSREIGTLRALGFSRGSVLLSFIFESVCLSLIGGLLGVLLALPINGLATGIGNFVTFTDVTFKFRVGLLPIFAGLAFAAIIGGLGGFLPAWAASRKDVVQAMRDA